MGDRKRTWIETSGGGVFRFNGGAEEVIERIMDWRKLETRRLVLVDDMWIAPTEIVTAWEEDRD